MSGRASIVGAAATHVGNVREHNEDAHLFDVDAGLFLVCDGMGGHAAGEVASALAVSTVKTEWSSIEMSRVTDAWLAQGTPEARKQLLGVVRQGVLAAHEAIVAEGASDDAKAGMGTTLVGAMVVGHELVFAHAGDSRAYLVRDGIAMQLTEDQTLLARLLAAGIEIDPSGEGSRFRSMLTNALGIAADCRVSTFFVPLADGDRFLLCSDGISEYIPEAEVGIVLTQQPSPARAAQKLIDLALDRGGSDNATAVVIRVLEVGETPQPARLRRKDDDAIEACPLWGGRVTPQQRLRALRIAIWRDFAAGEPLPAHTLGDRVAWIVVDGELERDGIPLEPGAFVYPESLVAGSELPERGALAVAKTEVRVLAIRSDDFRELCDEDAELGEALLEALAPLIARRVGHTTRRDREETKPEVVEVPSAIRAETPIPQVVTTEIADVPGTELGRAKTPPATPRMTFEPPPPAPATTDAVDATHTTIPPKPPEPAHAAVAVSSAPHDPPASPTIPTRIPRRAITEPEIEQIVEIEAEPPPEPKDFEEEVEMMVVSHDEGDARVTETVVDDSDRTMTLSVTESTEHKAHVRPPSITPDDSPTAAGTISVPDAPRAKRISEGWDDPNDDGT